MHVLLYSFRNVIYKIIDNDTSQLLILDIIIWYPFTANEINSLSLWLMIAYYKISTRSESGANRTETYPGGQERQRVNVARAYWMRDQRSWSATTICHLELRDPGTGHTNLFRQDCCRAVQPDLCISLP